MTQLYRIRILWSPNKAHDNEREYSATNYSILWTYRAFTPIQRCRETTIYMCVSAKYQEFNSALRAIWCVPVQPTCFLVISLDVCYQMDPWQRNQSSVEREVGQQKSILDRGERSGGRMSYLLTRTGPHRHIFTPASLPRRLSAISSALS